ncbi:hypothetical protein LPJ64_000579 [Coemansia asiatica]|uniref:Uncharacterized protein n=1 Tax=Coemansia asiatica TaxID=1052880 RepID=A0A9W7XQP2_9FUNG|nr:hypothetical protein LPJ64_000579 [Coemansia asiatica]KAJ2865613.1 hypothetical protein FB639_005096 [Coemansia asiatica]
MVRYAPSTKASVASDPYSLRIRGVVFDMDGTLATPMTEHLVKLHIELGVPSGMGILEYVDEFLQGAEREKAERRILEVETEAMANMQLSPGLLELLQFLHDNGLPIAIITRNNQVAAQHFLEQVVTRQPKDQWKWFRFDPVLDRSFKPTKPHPQGLLHISQKWGIPPQELMMVGDHLDDLLCGVRAGSVSALLRYRYNSAYECKAHISVDRIDKIIDSLAHGFEADMAIDGTTDMGGYA